MFQSKASLHMINVWYVLKEHSIYSFCSRSPYCTNRTEGIKLHMSDTIGWRIKLWTWTSLETGMKDKDGDLDMPDWFPFGAGCKCSLYTPLGNLLIDYLKTNIMWQVNALTLPDHLELPMFQVGSFHSHHFGPGWRNPWTCSCYPYLSE